MIKNLRVESYALWILIFLTIFFQGLYRERKRSLEEKTRENKPCEKKKAIVALVEVVIGTVPSNACLYFLLSFSR